MGVHQSLLDICREGEKGLFDVDVALCADFHEWDAELVGEGLTLFCAYGTLLFPVALVANQDLVDAFAGVLFDVGEPGADVCGSLLVAVLT